MMRQVRDYMAPPLLKQCCFWKSIRWDTRAILDGNLPIAYFDKHGEIIHGSLLRNQSPICRYDSPITFLISDANHGNTRVFYHDDIIQRSIDGIVWPCFPGNRAASSWAESALFNEITDGVRLPAIPPHIFQTRDPKVILTTCETNKILGIPGNSYRFPASVDDQPRSSQDDNSTELRSNMGKYAYPEDFKGLATKRTSYNPAREYFCKMSNYEKPDEDKCKMY